MRYFVTATRLRSLHKAADELDLSPGALSKAIARLEAELGVALTTSMGRGTDITSAGVLLAKRATHLLALEEATRLEVMGERGSLNVRIVGPEVLLLHFGKRIIVSLDSQYKAINYDLTSVHDEEAIAQVEAGTANLAIVTTEAHGQLRAAEIGAIASKLCVGPSHELFKRAQNGLVIPIDEILTYSFACPTLPYIGAVAATRAYDGWDDRRWPRRIGFKTSCLKMLEELVLTGKALAFLPELHIKRMGGAVVNCSVKDLASPTRVFVAARDADNLFWVKNLFSSLGSGEMPGPSEFSV